MFADDTILYVENPKESTTELLELINEFSGMAGWIQEQQYRKVTCVSMHSPWTINNEIKKILLTNRINYLGVYYI